MTAGRPTRKSNRTGPPRGATTLELCVLHAEAATSSTTGADDAKREAQEAIFNLLQHLSPVIGDLVGDRDAGTRSDWIACVAFLEGTGAFPKLAGLSLGLSALDRGAVDDLLEPISKKGPKNRTRELWIMRAIVEGSDELWDKLDGKHEHEFRPLLNELGTALGTIAGYRETLLREAPDLMRPRSYLLAYGYRDPRDVIRTATELLGRSKSAQSRHCRE